MKPNPLKKSLNAGESTTHNLSSIAEISRELSRGKGTDRLTRALGLLCQFLDAYRGLIAIRPDESREPAILAYYSSNKSESYQPDQLEEIVGILIKHSPPFLACNVLWIEHLPIEEKKSALISNCDKVLSFSLVFEGRNYGRVLAFLRPDTKPDDERLTISEILVDILSLYCSQEFTSARDNFTRTTTLRRITSLANTAYTLNEVLEAVGQEMRNTIGCRTCWAMLPDKKSVFRLALVGNHHGSVQWSSHHQEGAKSWIKKCISPLLLSSSEVKQNLGEHKILSLVESDMSLVIPVRSRDATLGLFALVLPDKVDFKEIWPLIEEFEGPIGAAISNAALLEEVVQRASEIAILNETAAALTTTFSINSILSIARRTLQTLIGNIDIDFDLQIETSSADREHKVFVEEEIKTETLGDGDVSLKIPIVAHEEMLGMITLVPTNGNEFSDHQLDLIKHIGHHLALVLKSAYLYQSERKMGDELAKSNENLEKANREIAHLYSNLEKLYEQLGSKLADLLKDQVEILLFTSPDCTHCATAERVTQEALKLYKGQVSYRKVNILLEKQTWKGRKILSVPALVIGDELLLGVPNPTRIHTSLFNVLLPLIQPVR